MLDNVGFIIDFNNEIFDEGNEYYIKIRFLEELNEDIDPQNKTLQIYVHCSDCQGDAKFKISRDELKTREQQWYTAIWCPNCQDSYFEINPTFSEIKKKSLYTKDLEKETVINPQIPQIYKTVKSKSVATQKLRKKNTLSTNYKRENSYRAPKTKVRYLRYRENMDLVFALSYFFSAISYSYFLSYILSSYNAGVHSFYHAVKNTDIFLYIYLICLIAYTVIAFKGIKYSTVYVMVWMVIVPVLILILLFVHI